MGGPSKVGIRIETVCVEGKDIPTTVGGIEMAGQKMMLREVEKQTEEQRLPPPGELVEEDLQLEEARYEVRCSFLRFSGNRPWLEELLLCLDTSPLLMVSGGCRYTGISNGYRLLAACTH